MFLSAQTTPTDTAVRAPEEPLVTEQRSQFMTEPTLQKVAQTRLTNLAANMSNRMDGVVARLQNVTNRLTSRLQKMEDEGKNVTAAKDELVRAQEKLAEVKFSLSTIDTQVNAFVGSATPRENWNNLKSTYLTNRDLIISTHQSILATIDLAQNASTAVIAATSTIPTDNN